MLTSTSIAQCADASNALRVMVHGIQVCLQCRSEGVESRISSRSEFEAIGLATENA